MARKEADNYLLDVIRQMPNGEFNYNLYKETLPTITDAEMDTIVTRIEAGEYYWPIFVYNMDKEHIDVDKVIELGEKLGVVFFQPLLLTDQVTGEPYQTPIKYLTVDGPVRTQIQSLVEKISAAEGHSIDHLGGQATGDTKSTTMSLPELTQLDARGFKAVPLELASVRGGDEKGYRALTESLRETGGASLGAIKELGTRPKAIDTLRSFLIAMHFKPTGLD